MSENDENGRRPTEISRIVLEFQNMVAQLNTFLVEMKKASFQVMTPEEKESLWRNINKIKNTLFEGNGQEPLTVQIKGVKKDLEALLEFRVDMLKEERSERRDRATTKTAMVVCIVGASITFIFGIITLWFQYRILHP